MINVGIGQDDRATLPEQKPPPLERMGLIRGSKPTADEVQILMRQEALTAVDAHAVSNLHSELGGVLLGRAFQHNGLKYVQIEAAVIAHSEERGPVHFTFTADAWANIHREREAKYPDLQIVGWYHTHPDLGVFYSSDDVVVHSVAFDMPWHVGLVVDPVRRECCFFGWFAQPSGQQELDPIRGFYELTNVQSGSVVDWRVTHRSGLAEMIDAAYHTYSSAGEVYNDQVYAVAREATLFPPRINFGIAAFTLLLTLVLFSVSFFSMRNRTSNLEEVAVLLASDRMQEQVAAGVATCPNPYMQIVLPESQTTVVQGRNVEFTGVADLDRAGMYHLQYKQIGPLNYRRLSPSANKWESFDTFRRAKTFQTLGTWQTGNFDPGTYEIRVVAQDRQSGVFVNSSACTILMTVLPAPPPPAPTPTPAIEATADPAEVTLEPEAQTAPTPDGGAATGGTTNIDN